MGILLAGHPAACIVYSFGAGGYQRRNMRDRKLPRGFGFSGGTRKAH